MSFREHLARNFADAQQGHEAHTQRVMNAWVTKIKEQLMRHCEAVSRRRRTSFKMGVPRPLHLSRLGVGEDVLRQQLREMLNELGFHDGSVSAFDRIYWKSRGNLWQDIHCAQVMARWSGDDAPVVDDAAMPVSEQPDGAMAMAAMAFGQQLARNVNDYGAQTQGMILSEVSRIKEKFMELCKLHSMAGLSACSNRFPVSQSLADRSDFNHDMMKDKLEEHLADLGFSSLQASRFIDQIFSEPQCYLELSARWDPDALTDDPPQVTGGTCASCPICYQHRPAVALVPCGHVVCRDCHRSERLRQCPMCREVTISATRGLFIDQ